MHCRRISRLRHGFTLVELLVVIAIIAVLAGVSLAAYSSAISRAKTAACEGNLRAIGIGLLSFAADNDGCLPESGGTIPYGTVDAPPPNGSGKNGWTQQLEPYMGGVLPAGSTGINKIYTCPDSSKTIPANINYSYFNGGHAAYAEAGAFGSVRLAKIHNPSALIMAGDIAFNTFSATDCDKDDYTADPAFGGITSTDDGKTGSAKIPIHNGSVNILFADGHIENLKGFDNTNMTTVYEGPGSKYNYLYSP
jgi:prepilin-type N-terminal cleavage/methylation domain-containing protein/prepilin-type processing-associated H-X9-DG protein